MSSPDRPETRAQAPTASEPSPVSEDTDARLSAGRREATALCYDLVGSTELFRLSDLEDIQDLLADVHRLAGEAVRAQGGVLRDELGDGGLALFQLPVASKDAVSSAIEAGLAIVNGCREVATARARDDLHVRVGIATSLVLADADQGESSVPRVTGAALAMAARLQANAEPDTVVVSDKVHTLARRSHVFVCLGMRQLKGFDHGEVVWRVVKRKRVIDRFSIYGRLRTPMFGRQAELALALDRWREAAAGNGQILFLEGEAGIGKSRLLHEILRRARAERPRVVRFQCSPWGKRSMLHPIVNGLINVDPRSAERGGQLTFDSVRTLLAREGIVEPDVVETISFLVGAGGPAVETLAGAGADRLRDRMFAVMEHCLQQWANPGPLILAVEDVHWIDPTSQELLEELGRGIGSHPVLLVLTSRSAPPSAWQDLGNLAPIPLRRLDEADARLTMAAMWRTDRPEQISDEASDLIYQVTGGVPLFIEELCQWLMESAEEGRSPWQEALSRVRSASLESILSARLAGLGAAKEVAMAASVLGRHFDTPLLGAILPTFDAGALEGQLDTLVDAGLLVRDRYLGARSFAFRHALIQETLYGMLLRKSRQVFHRRVMAAIKRTPELGHLMGTAVLAWHAECAGMIEEAVERYIRAGEESFALSAMTEARQLVEHALQLINDIDGEARREVLKLSAIAALGPVLTSTEGKKSAQACQLYEEAVRITRRRPAEEQAGWFPIYWGWWFTGSDFAVMRERAQTILGDLRSVADAEVQLQARHCVWAIDFNVGRHDSCLAAVDAGLRLYKPGRGRETFALYGGHDAKVCGLGQKGLSLWLTGRCASAVQSVSQCRDWAHKIGHLGSLAHAYDIEAMFHRYRRDIRSLRTVVASMLDLAEHHGVPAIGIKARIFEGWCMGLTGDPHGGRRLVEQNFEANREIDTVEDFPVYWDMLAELMALTDDADAGVDLLAMAIQEAERTGHRYWLAELHRRRALLLWQADAPPSDVVSALEMALQVAREQSASALLLSAAESARALGLAAHIPAAFLPHIERAHAQIEPGPPLVECSETVPPGRDNRTFLALW
jgi:predicted ATPase/class 3 adenylate cyclase